MYEERRNTFNLRDVILQLLLIILFVFIMIWLFPTKSYLKENFVGKEELNSELALQLEGLYGRLFTDNIESMRDAAQGYFTNARLPKNVGDSVTLTLDEMLEKRLVLSFRDSNNKTCDVDSSYVQVTKMNDEYQMKVQLSCSDYEDYIIVYMGCYDYCDSDICIKEETTETTTKPSTKPTPSNPDKPSGPETPVVNKKYEYEYRLITQNTYSEWGPWSDWSKDKVTANTLRQVEIDKRNEFVRYETETYYVTESHTEYRTETIKVEDGTNRVLVGTKVVDTKPAQGGSKTEKVYFDPTVTTTAGSYSDWVYRGTITSNYALGSTNNTKYTYVSHKTTVDCTDVCKNVTTYIYEKYTRTYNAGTTTYSCVNGYKEGSGSSTKCYRYVTTNTGNLSCSSYGSDYKLSGTNCVKTENVYKDEVKYKTETVKVPYTVNEQVKKTRKVPIYEKLTYYRYRVRKQLTEAGITYKWSTSKNDKKLLAAGYELTGNKREI